MVFIIGGALWFRHLQISVGFSFWWNVPVVVAAIVLIGGVQHQLAALGHEGAHHMLFKNRYLNELISDWFCMFPLSAQTYYYRIVHLTHHQHVNDEERDGDRQQLLFSGHNFPFPMSKRKAWRTLLAQLWPHRLFLYNLGRIKYDSLLPRESPYRYRNSPSFIIPGTVGIVYFLLMLAVPFILAMQQQVILLAIVPAACWLLMIGYYATLSPSLLRQCRLHCVIPYRWLIIMRLTYVTIVVNGLAWIIYATESTLALYGFAVLWVLPLLTSFAVYMMLRQLFQHGNAGQGALTNTRVFGVNRFVRFCIFPLGQDYHLPHHLYATVPHFRLKALHELLLKNEAYSSNCCVISGLLNSPRRAPARPTALDQLTRALPSQGRAIFVDKQALAYDTVDAR